MDCIENDASNNSIAGVFIVTITFFTEPLSSKDGGIHIQTDRWEGFMKYAIETGPGAMIYIPSFMKIGSGIQKLIGGYTDSIVIS
jgi:hypothetical protein